MATKINIDDIIDANSHTSAMALTADWAKVFSIYALENYEELSDDPASSFNIFLHLTAQGAAKMMYEQQARINETNVATAILPKSLLNKLSSDELVGIFGTPASTTLAFCIKKSDIIKFAVYNETEKVSQIIINKNLTATFESHPTFTLPYNVIINCKEVTNSNYDTSTGEYITTTDHNIYAHYDMPLAKNDGMRSIFNINNPNISSREMRFEGETYVAFFIKIFQMKRKEVEFYVSDPYTADTGITFTDNLIGFEVFRIPISTKTEVLMQGFPEGTALTSNTYNYSYDTKRNRNNFNLSFSKMNDSSALTVGDTIRVVVYTTQGTVGNIEFPYMAENIKNLIMEYNQDLSIASQNTVLNFQALAFVRDKSSTGGTDSLSLEQIRHKITSKMYSRDLLISNQEIINKGLELGLNIKKIRQDLMSMYYQSIDKLIYKNMILSTGTNDFYFDLSKKSPLVSSSRKYYMIEPTDIFKFDKSSRRFEYIPSYDENNSENTAELFNDYVNAYNDATEKEDVLEVSFPFYMRYENGANPKVQVYDMHINEVALLNFTKYDESTALDKLDINSVKIIRNPYRGSSNGSFDKTLSNQYVIQFMVYTGVNTMAKLLEQTNNSDNSLNYVNASNETDYLKQYITFEVSLVDKDNIKMIINPVNFKIVNVDTMETDGYIMYQGYFESTNYVTNDFQLQVKGVRPSNSINTNYNLSQYVNSTVKVHIVGTFNDEINNFGNKSCIEYETDDIHLVKSLNDDFDIAFDIETKPLTYKTYDSNISYKYDKLIRIRNLGYDPSITDISDPNHYEFKTIVHNGVVVMLDSKTPRYIYAHSVGDIMFDYTKISEEDRANGPLISKEYYYVSDIDENGDNVYEKVDTSNGFEDDVVYYTAKERIKHKRGDLIYYNRLTGEQADDVFTPDDINYINKPNDVEYTGICKNVPWINRLYMAGESMFNKIIDLYYDIIDRTSSIRNSLFDGGKIFIGLSNTSGKSKKYMAYKLSTNSKEFLNDLALAISFKVKYQTNENFEYKNEQIKNATINYINNIGENMFSVDKLFESIKNAVPDIEYINITKINNYKHGEVQTIVNDSSINDEFLTVSQKITTNESGDVDFEPNINIDVIQVDI